MKPRSLPSRPIGAGKATLLSIATALLPACGSTPILQNWIDVNYAHAPGPWPPLYGAGPLRGGDAVSDAIIVELTIWLDHVAEFTFVFPDGHRVGSRAITADVLREHGRSLGELSPYNKPGPDRQEWRSQDGSLAVFELHSDRATILELCVPLARARSINASILIATADGKITQMPLTYGELVRVFGEPTYHSKEFLIAKWRC
jgi:hypothetical protein